MNHKRTGGTQLIHESAIFFLQCKPNNYDETTTRHEQIFLLKLRSFWNRKKNKLKKKHSNEPKNHETSPHNSSDFSSNFAQHWELDGSRRWKDYGWKVGGMDPELKELGQLYRIGRMLHQQEGYSGFFTCFRCRDGCKAKQCGVAWGPNADARGGEHAKRLCWPCSRPLHWDDIQRPKCKWQKRSRGSIWKNSET